MIPAAIPKQPINAAKDTVFTWQLRASLPAWASTTAT
ncbi:uncharacterized protein METZ01_LOCUS48733 [marine metagenome]|uniref:Uncharacterized protein n=1 Tax=marine metagenome TaxID=408172 RepID=A0A381RXQ0_9ZZZZ